MGFVLQKLSTGAGFLQVLPFPLLILVPSDVSFLSSIIRGWDNGLLTA
jgi:hypothetical protein